MPTDIDQALAHAVESTIAMKEGAVKDSKRSTDDIVPTIFAWRDDKMVALIMPDQIDRDKGLHAVLLAAAGLSADVVTLTNDAHVTQSMTNPRTGERWGPGEMQQACDEDGACDVGLITDTLWTAAIGRDGAIVGHNAPYHVHKGKHTMTWVKNDQAMDERNTANRLTGIVPDAMREAMTAPQLADDIHADLDATFVGTVFGDAAKARVHLDCIIAKMLIEDGYTCVLMAENEEAARIIDRSMASAGFRTVKLGER